jgi:glycerol-3-phosphate dehydrogenase
MQRDLAALVSTPFDIAVIGGGMHGAWIALRAVQAGKRVALIERDDFGAATSANSLKILHGGLRYLQHLDFTRMRSSIRARREFGRLAPHLVRALPCVMPLQPFGVRSPWVLGPALMTNDVISIDRNWGVQAQARLPMGRLLGSSAMRSQLAPLTDVDAVGGALWWDAVALDVGRLTLEPILRAAEHGAVMANRVQARHYLIQDGAIKGVVAVDRVTGQSLEVKAAAVVNATGPWAGELSRASGLPVPFLPKAWSGGLNVILRKSLGIDAAVALSSVSKAADTSAVLKRATRELFFVPWRGLTMVGTDYHPVREPQEGVAPPAGAVEHFVAEIAAVAPKADVRMEDVALVHWGLLPADDSGTATPRKSAIVASGAQETGVDGLIIVIAEKLTSAPVLSQAVLQRAAMRSRRGAPQPVAPVHPLPDATPLHPSMLEAQPRLAARYGNAWRKVADHGREFPELLARIHPDTSTRGVEIIHAIREEMALSLEDIVLRRLGLADIGDPGDGVIRCCADIAARELAWESARIEREVAAVDAALRARTAR